MNRYNTQLPEVRISPPVAPALFSMKKIWGYVFLLVSFALAVSFIYMMQYGKAPVESRVCIQMVTPAKNAQTGEVKDFPTPCDVPEGWEAVNEAILPLAQ